MIRSIYAGMALAVWVLAAGCGKSPLRRFVFAPRNLPANVSLAPWDGSDKLPFMKRNPQVFAEREVIDSLAEDAGFDAQLISSVRSVLMAVYWEENGGEVGEIGVTAIQFKDGASAEKAKGMFRDETVNDGGKPDEKFLDHSGEILVFMGRAPGVTDSAWAKMKSLVRKALTQSLK